MPRISTKAHRDLQVSKQSWAGDWAAAPCHSPEVTARLRSSSKASSWAFLEQSGRACERWGWDWAQVRAEDSDHGLPNGSSTQLGLQWQIQEATGFGKDCL